MARPAPTDTPSALVATMRSPAPDLGPRATRTIARILEAARSVFVTRGYSGTTIDEIARTADISRASVYTYFPTKRDVLLALGALSADNAEAVNARFAAEHPGRSFDDVVDLVDVYFDVLEDHHGAFATAWPQAASEDDELRKAGMRRHLRLCVGLGALLGPTDGAELRGLAAYSLMERAWSYARLYEGHIDVDDLKVETARVLYASISEAPPVRSGQPRRRRSASVDR